MRQAVYSISRWLVIFALFGGTWARSQTAEPGQNAEQLPVPGQQLDAHDIAPLNGSLTKPTSSPQPSTQSFDNINSLLLRLKVLAKARAESEKSSDADDAESSNSQAGQPQVDTVTLSVSTMQSGVTVEPADAATEAPKSLTSTVDKLLLADNLFVQGKINFARPIYEELAKGTRTPDDMVWIQYQLASCYRIEGDIKLATKLYRRVGSSKGDPYWPSRAHWWLDYLGRAQRLEERRQQLEKNLGDLQKLADDLRKK